jgi:hypothetical protein
VKDRDAAVKKLTGFTLFNREIWSANPETLGNNEANAKSKAFVAWSAMTGEQQKM